MSSFFTFRLRSGAGDVSRRHGRGSGSGRSRWLQDKSVHHSSLLSGVNASHQSIDSWLLSRFGSACSCCSSYLAGMLGRAGRRSVRCLVPRPRRLLRLSSSYWSSRPLGRPSRPVSLLSSGYPSPPRFQLASSVSLSYASSSGPPAPAAVTATELLTSIASVPPALLSKWSRVLVLRCRFAGVVPHC
jgi:hypothetical protein